MVLQMTPIVAFISMLLVSQIGITGDRLGLPKLQIPAYNPQSPEKIVLGKMLFNDTRFSADNTVSCASCHQADKGFTDGRPVAKGIHQLVGTRNTPTLINSAFYTSLFLDGRRLTLEAQALDPLVNPIEHGLKDYRPILDVVQKDLVYRGRFNDVFDVNATDIAITHVVSAIASYERTLITGNSPFDRFFFGGEKNALSKSEIRGLNLFRRKGNCANCHEISWNNALFTDNRFYNIGIGYQSIEKVLETYLEELQSSTGEENPKAIVLSHGQRSEFGRFMVTLVTSDIGKFRTPTLRNIATTGPYMHDGSLKTLEEVIEYYDIGGNKNPYLDPAIFPLNLSSQEKIDLLAFLTTLTSPRYRPNTDRLNSDDFNLAGD